MTKKTHSVKIKLPFIEYNWYKEITKEKPNIEIIQNQIENFLFVVQNKDSFKISDLREELKSFTSLVLGHGLITKLEQKYIAKFLQINKFVKEYFDTSPRVFNLSR